MSSSALPSTSRKSPSQDAEPFYEDHRKRKRNRTSKSCINCRMAKRQCDRQRPACQRCVSLGLTGLCAFEVDDTPACSDPRDENTRLRRRIAELERVIRELQRKPHPRWAPSGLGSESIFSSDLLKGSSTPSCNESDAEMSGAITLTMPFAPREVQSTPELSSNGESITSSSTSSGASTPSESAGPKFRVEGNAFEPLIVPPVFQPIVDQNTSSNTWNAPAPIHHPPPNMSTSPQGMSFNEAYALGYSDHFSTRPVAYDISEAAEYPGGTPSTIPRPIMSKSVSDPSSVSSDKSTPTFTSWPTISLGDEAATP